MFKKSNPDNDKRITDSSETVTEVIETKDGVIQTTRTTVTSSGSKGSMETFLKDLNMDSSHSSGTYVTKKVVYSTSSSGTKQITEEKIDVFEREAETNGKTPEKKPSKPLAERLGFKSKPKDKALAPSGATKAPPAGKFEEDCLRSHNEYRKKHGVPPLKLSKQLCAYSKEWAAHLAATDSFEHRKERKYGENIFMKWSSDPTHAVAGNEAVDSWYSEIKDYTFGREPTSLKSGHFTQVVWRESEELGVAWARSKSGKVLVVANYSPAGNFVGRFAANVPPPKK